MPTLICPQISQTQFDVSFEIAAERLQKLARLCFELDGSFVWAGRIDDEAWQIYGMLYDYGDRLQRMELQGICPLGNWRELLRIFERESRPQVAHLIDHHCFVDAQVLGQVWAVHS
jgi:hypothetical protein